MIASAAAPPLRDGAARAEEIRFSISAISTELAGN
jgi:hypothetical protein